ncbi:BAG family molecular chaperone regulator 3, partial [Rhinoderma darwinii]|uniref:BAG family molecular chaperone regulator 3 n=1 Tax=Rhinoderma darwinii TaxID=43563 RepID=UPI003F6656E1
VNRKLCNGPFPEGPKSGNFYSPQLRPGYIPISVQHEGVETRPQLPFLHAPQPGVQRVKCEPPVQKRPQSPLQGPDRPHSPAWSPPESPSTDKQGGQVTEFLSSRGSSKGQSPPPSDLSNVSQQGPGRQGHPLPRGYIPIPVIHEGNIPRPPSLNVQQNPHQPVYHRIQDERPPRENSPSRTMPPPVRVQIPIQRVSPARSHVEAEPSPVPAVPIQKTSTPDVHVSFTSGPPSSPPAQTGPPSSPPAQTGPPSSPPAQTGPPSSPPAQTGPPSSPPAQTGPPSSPPAQTRYVEEDSKSFPQKVEQEELSCPQALEEAGVPPELAEPQDRHPGVLQIESILHRVQALQEAVANFRGSKNKKYLMLEEYLTKELLALDSVDPEGRADVRQARRDGVREVQNILETLELKSSDNPAMDPAANSQEVIEFGGAMEESRGASSSAIPAPSERPLQEAVQEVFVPTTCGH